METGVETKVIKISKHNYDWLLSIMTSIQKQEKKQASFDDALSSVRRQRISDLAGSWKISEKDSDKLIKDIYNSRTWSRRSV